MARAVCQGAKTAKRYAALGAGMEVDAQGYGREPTAMVRGVLSCLFVCLFLTLNNSGETSLGKHPIETSLPEQAVKASQRRRVKRTGEAECAGTTLIKRRPEYLGPPRRDSGEKTVEESCCREDSGGILLLRRQWRNPVAEKTVEESCCREDSGGKPDPRTRRTLQHGRSERSEGESAPAHKNSRATTSRMVGPPQRRRRRSRRSRRASREHSL